jgi:hypothetical protein
LCAVFVALVEVEGLVNKEENFATMIDTLRHDFYGAVKVFRCLSQATGFKCIWPGDLVSY